MEVNIALLIMAVGLLGVFSLFPLGLRQSDAATSDTTQAAFADQVLNAMRANASLVTNWTGVDGWTRLTTAPIGMYLGVNGNLPTPPGNQRKLSVPLSSGGTQDILCDGIEHEIEGYLLPDHYIKYVLHLQDDPNTTLIKIAWIQVTDRRYTSVGNTPVYATSFVYMGM